MGRVFSAVETCYPFPVVDSPHFPLLKTSLECTDFLVLVAGL
jgi:hypothetical protein